MVIIPEMHPPELMICNGPWPWPCTFDSESKRAINTMFHPGTGTNTVKDPSPGGRAPTTFVSN